MAPLIAVSLIGCGHPDVEPLDVRVTGRGFYWHFTYPGEDRTLGTPDDVTFANELRLPVNRPVTLTVTSEDYVYTFRSPELGITEVAIPELAYIATATPVRAGRHDLEVDPLCGFNFLHDNATIGHIVVVSEAEFERWLADATAHPRRAPAAEQRNQ